MSNSYDEHAANAAKLMRENGISTSSLDRASGGGLTSIDKSIKLREVQEKLLRGDISKDKADQIKREIGFSGNGDHHQNLTDNIIPTEHHSYLVDNNFNVGDNITEQLTNNATDHGVEAVDGLAYGSITGPDILSDDIIASIGKSMTECLDIGTNAIEHLTDRALNHGAETLSDIAGHKAEDIVDNLLGHIL